MITKWVSGCPYKLDAVVQEVPAVDHAEGLAACALGNGLEFTRALGDGDRVYGLGETSRGINKRGCRLINYNVDNAHHRPDTVSLYGAHNFIIVSGQEHWGFFFDTPARVIFDIDVTTQGVLSVQCDSANVAVYSIREDSDKAVAESFLRIIGRSYIPPLWAFGFGQSRWGYKTKADFRAVADGYQKRGIHLDYLCMDIDYMDRFIDFTFNPKNFPDFGDFCKEMKERGIRLVPIVDAGLKIEPGNPVYEEGVAKNYFCKNKEGKDFQAAVWPGMTHFTDFFQPEAREWFGRQYAFYTEQGVEGFWNDMNEPAIFYSREGLAERLDHPPVPHEDGTIDHFGQAIGWLNLSNAPEDYARFYHKVDGKMVRHDQVHNLYGYNMTRAASEGLASIAPGKRFLLFSRSSCIGMHRYGGVWTGDNHSWWSHLLLNLKMLPSLNMCGFLYVGADLGGFNADTSRDLLLRWLALGVFTPLMRNHSGSDTRRQEFYQFEGPEDFRSVIETRYRLIPYLYSEYMKAALNGDMLFKPLAFVYPEDEIALQTEDQLMLGNEVMIAPVYTQNATGRMVYLPEEMLFVKFGPDGRITQEVLPAGTHFVKVALNEVPLFIRKGACIPVADPAQTVADIDPATIRMIGWPGASYDRYDDDGVTIPAE